MSKVPGQQKMLKVAFFLAILALGGSYGTPAQDKSVKPNGGSSDDMTSGGDQEKMNSEAVKRTVDLMEVMNQCNDSFRIDMAFIDALHEGGSFPDETDRTPKCYVLCVLKNSGVFTDEGFDPARAAEVFAGERGGKIMTDLQELAAGCTDRKEACKCERSYRFMKCFMEAQIKEYASN